MSFSNVSIRAKVFGAFALVVCVTLGLGAFALMRVGALRSEANLISSDVVGIKQLAIVARDLERLQALTGLQHIARNDAERETLAVTIGQVRDEMAVSWREYEKTVDPGEEQHLAEMVKASWQEFDAAAVRVFDLDKAVLSGLAPKTPG